MATEFLSSNLSLLNKIFINSLSLAYNSGDGAVRWRGEEK